MPSVKRAGQLAPPPPPTILAQPGQPAGQNNNRKKLQLQFSFQEKSVSDEEENDDEIVFHENPYAGCPSTSLLSDEDDEVTTSPSLTFGVEPHQHPRSEIPTHVATSRGRGGHKAEYRALQRNNSRSEPGPENSQGVHSHPFCHNWDFSLIKIFIATTPFLSQKKYAQKKKIMKRL